MDRYFQRKKRTKFLVFYLGIYLDGKKREELKFALKRKKIQNMSEEYTLGTYLVLREPQIKLFEKTMRDCKKPSSRELL